MNEVEMKASKLAKQYLPTTQLDNGGKACQLQQEQQIKSNYAEISGVVRDARGNAT